MMRSSVVLPQPLGPSSETSSPCSNWKAGIVERHHRLERGRAELVDRKTLRTFLITPNAINPSAAAIGPKLALRNVRRRAPGAGVGLPHLSIT